ncbi:MAG TPA: 30S ribosomal protein S17 [Patescibacteria group bacterium]|nr:30S ribosomal protein S17 [Patescibacteria group bacterium]
MARKTFIGKVVSNKMTKTVVVEVERTIKHPVYKKLMRRTGKIKADTNGMEIAENVTVKIEQSRPMSKGKNFKVIEIIKEKGEKSS